MNLYGWKIQIIKKTQRKRLRNEARERYQNFSKEEKDKGRKKARERYRNITEEDK